MHQDSSGESFNNYIQMTELRLTELVLGFSQLIDVENQQSHRDSNYTIRIVI